MYYVLIFSNVNLKKKSYFQMFVQPKHPSAVMYADKDLKRIIA